MVVEGWHEAGHREAGSTVNGGRSVISERLHTSQGAAFHATRNVDSDHK